MTPTFKEQIDLDMQAVHLNPAEMAEEITIDGVVMPAVFEVRKGEPEGNPGVNITEYELRVRAADITVPRPGQSIEIVGEQHFVRSVERELGMLTIFTYRNEA